MGCTFRLLMKSLLALILLTALLNAHGELPFKLPPKAKYTASSQAIERAKQELSINLVTNAATLSNLFVRPTMCGPGLWHILKDSPHFSKPPLAKSTVQIPVGKSKVQELPVGLLQDNEEVESFRNALADLLSSQGKLTIREPNHDEFMKYWVAIPFDKITGPLV